MDSLLKELRKVPPVTRILCGSSLAVTVPLLLGVLSPYTVVLIMELVWKRFEIWRLYTTFFYGLRMPRIAYLFDFFMLYRNSDQLETTRYKDRSGNYAWQLILVGGAILALNIPLSSVIHTRPFALALIYLAASLSPPGAQSSLFGLISFPTIYLPYVTLAIDFLESGPAAVATGVSGLVVGHIWWWGVWGGVIGSVSSNGVLAPYGVAPRWMRRFFGDDPDIGAQAPRTGVDGVYVTPPRRQLPSQGGTGTTTSGHNWGTGHRLGGS